MIKLIAMDFDWTLVDHSKNTDAKIGKELVEKLNQFIKNGNYAGIVSGRNCWDFRPDFAYENIPWAEEFPNYVISREAYIYKTTKDDFIGYDEYNSAVGKKTFMLNREISGYLEEIFLLLEKEDIKIGNFFIYGDFATEIHVSLKNADRAMEIVKNYILEKQVKNAAVHRNGIMVTIYHKEAGKGNALKAYADMLGIKYNEVLAIGDNFNDVSMIDGSLGFIGACVGNADDKIKEIVKAGGGYVGEGIAWRGILDVLEKAEKDGQL